MYGESIQNVKIIDTATPFLRRMIEENPKYVARALKSTGWWVQKALKYEISIGAPGGQQYKEFSGIKNLHQHYRTVQLNRISKRTGQIKTVRRRYERNQFVKERGKHKPLGRLGSAIGYKYYSDSMRVVVGWLSLSAQRLGLKHEQGFELELTPRMRRLFFASGLSIGKKRKLVTPKRATFDPFYSEKAPQIVPHVEKKIWEYIKEAGNR